MEANADPHAIGPVAESVRTGYADTKSDFTGLANSANTRPEQKLATGQQRTSQLNERQLTRRLANQGFYSLSFVLL